MEQVFVILTSGIVATLIMTAVMYLLTWQDFRRGDMVRAIGSLITRDYQRAFVYGLIVHGLVGITFAFLYYWALSFLGFDHVLNNMTYGALMGACHGFVVAFPLHVGLAEYHPVREFQKFTIPIALVHITGHIIYGLFVAALMGAYLTGGLPSFLVAFAAALFLLGLVAIQLLRQSSSGGAKDPSRSQEYFGTTQSRTQENSR